MPDLAADPAAVWIIKDEVVSVEFARQAGALQSAVGLNGYAASDALLTGSTGDRWCVSRDRFDAKYRAEAPTVAGQPGRYRNVPVPVLAKRMPIAFTVRAQRRRRCPARRGWRLAHRVRARRPWHRRAGAVRTGLSPRRYLLRYVNVNPKVRGRNV